MGASRADVVPWQPEGLPAAREVGDWRYVVVEELIDGLALLRRCSWPFADERGHLVWPDEAADATTATVILLQAQLYTPNGLRRDPRIGDTFAVVADRAGSWPDHTEDPSPRT